MRLIPRGSALDEALEDMSGGTLLTVDESKLVGRSYRTMVYIHPEDESKVLKICIPERLPAVHRSRCWYSPLKSRSRFDENLKNFRHYRRMEKKLGHLPGCICTVFDYAETTKGPALVVEHVRNGDGRTSENLIAYVRKSGLSKTLPLLDPFFEDLATYHVVARDMDPKNILVREGDDRVELVLIDGMNDPSIIPLATLFKAINRKKLERRKEVLIQNLVKLSQDTDGNTLRT